MANPNAKAVVCTREAPGCHVGALPRIKRPHSYQTQHLEPAKRPSRDTQPPPANPPTTYHSPIAIGEDVFGEKDEVRPHIAHRPGICVEEEPAAQGRAPYAVSSVSK